MPVGLAELQLGDRADDLLTRADAALYDAKHRGGASCCSLAAPTTSLRLMTVPPRIGITSWPQVVTGSRTPLPNDTVPRSCNSGPGSGWRSRHPPLVERQDLDLLLDVVDGLVIIGGGDLDPTVYGHHHPRTRSIDAERARSTLVRSSR